MIRFFQPERIYLDYASAPPVHESAHAAMDGVRDLFGNPGAIHREGVQAKRALEQARERIAKLLGVKAREIIFCSGLTESNNIAILGLARKFEREGRDLSTTHWIVSSIEHASVLESFSDIERRGGTVTHVDPDQSGTIRPEALARALRKETVLVSIGWANNEIGTVQPLREIARAIHSHEQKQNTTVLLHADAGQAPLYLPTLVHSLHVDLLSLGGNKLYGPHGVGALFVGARAEIAGIIAGGPQERNLRAGTENVALAVGFTAAFEHVAAVREDEARRLQTLRNDFKKDIVSRLPEAILNGEPGLPHMLNISIPRIQSEYVALALDAKGIAISTKSACKEGEESESHVVAALGEAEGALLHDRASSSLRFSLGEDTTARNLAFVAETLAEIVHRTRG